MTYLRKHLICRLAPITDDCSHGKQRNGTTLFRKEGRSKKEKTCYIYMSTDVFTRGAWMVTEDGKKDIDENLGRCLQPMLVASFEL